MTLNERLSETLDFLIKQDYNTAEIGIILGTGLGQLVNKMKITKEIDYQEIPYFPVSTVESHKGKLILAEYQGRTILAMHGRFHYYEGYSMEQITYPVRCMKLLGIKKLLISNAAGNMNRNFDKGELMLIDDHINFQPDNPLIGLNDSKLGPRFPDMSCPYDKGMNEKLMNCAKELGITLRKGVYVSVTGPNLETRAEYRMFGQIADAIGMSTVPEVLVANHMSLPCAAISVLTDDCDPDNLKPVELEEILAIAAEAEKDLIRLFEKVVPLI